MLSYRRWNRAFTPGERGDPNQIPDFPLAIAARHAIRIILEEEVGDLDWIPAFNWNGVYYEPPFPIETKASIPVPEDLRGPLLEWLEFSSSPYTVYIDGALFLLDDPSSHSRYTAYREGTLFLLDDPWGTPYPANGFVNEETLVGLNLLRRGFRPNRSTLSPQSRLWFTGHKAAGPVKPFQSRPPLPRGKDRRAGFEEPAEIPTGPE